MKLPKPLTGPHTKSALPRINRITSMLVKVAITANFSDMTKWVVLSGVPVISSGKLTGRTAVRYVDEMATDNYTVTATIGAVNDGRAWLVTSANPNFDRFYAVELNRGLGSTIWSIIDGTGIVATTSTGIFGIISGIIGFLLGLFEDIIAALLGKGPVSQAVTVGGEVSAWWDEANSIVRAYYNGVQVTSLAVPRHELQHTAGYRYFGIVSGIDGDSVGVQYNSVTAEDV